jgi:hypothetical protein
MRPSNISVELSRAAFRDCDGGWATLLQPRYDPGVQLTSALSDNEWKKCEITDNATAHNSG